MLDAGDPFFGTNELTYSWVALENWTYVLTLPRERWQGNNDLVNPRCHDGHGGRRGVGGGGGDSVGDGDGAHASDSGVAGGSSDPCQAAVVGLLTFEGIDTFAHIRVNGREVGR